ncbi:MAG TPA: polysaccharide biosynthesis/export family protein [Tepidisphaeraceae bacterium]|jgi:polysaccharide export outer membrane protein
MTRSAAALFIGLTLAIVSGGCQEARQSDPVAEGPQGLFRPATEKEVAATEYRVAPPDKLSIKAPGIKELDNFTTTIRPDGKISVPLLNDLYVAGKTPEELSKLLTDAASKYYNNADIKVEVSDYQSKHYMVVSPNVRDQGKKPFTGRDTVISALAAAGFTDDSWPQQVSLSRPAKNGQPRATAIIDFKYMAMTGDMRQNYLLEENDIIYVPNSPLTQLRLNTNNILGPLGQGAGTVGAVQGVGPAPK